MPEFQDRERPVSDHTFFLPTTRTPEAEIHQEREQALADPTLRGILEALPGGAAVLNRNRQVLAINSRFRETFHLSQQDPVIGKRLGEAIKCLHSDEEEGGCGTSRSCTVCEVARRVCAVFENGQRAEGEFRLRSEVEDFLAMELDVVVVPLWVRGIPFVVLGARDISVEKRRAVLERMFFHDVLNTAGGIRGLAEVLAMGVDLPTREVEEYHRWMLELSSRLVDEIQYQRKLLAAEKGDLRPENAILALEEVLEPVRTLYVNHPVAEGKVLLTGPAARGYIVVDPFLLRRVLGNLVKNALEATPEGGTVTLSSEARGDRVVFSVQNPGVMSPEVCLQLFQRSFSTKGTQGRGIGTYSVKLFGEKVMGGEVTYETSEEKGTCFRLDLPIGSP